MKEIRRLASAGSELVLMVYEFRLILHKLNKSPIEYTIKEAFEETSEYFKDNKIVFGLYDDDLLIGFSVLKFENDVYWLEWHFIDRKFRGFENASLLFDYTENYVLEKGAFQMYIWVHPDNRQMLRFLKKKGYDVLNLVEVKKIKPDASTNINILGNELRY
ncbi:GNAT family N-acetyltransferase [candidate division WOR-3 bacterium]|nr:GNAT family N-acetyltransferase [candidate division WOR-3 bacterium]